MKPSEKFRLMSEAAAKMSRKKILVGWIDPEEKHIDPDSGKKTISNGKLARVLCTGWEAGTGADGREYPRLPARDFFKVARTLYKSKLDSLTKKNMVAISTHKITDEKACKQLAEFWLARIQQAMRKSSEYEKLAKSTIAARKSRNKSLKAKDAKTPLVDTGILIGSITYKVI